MDFLENDPFAVTSKLVSEQRFGRRPFNLCLSFFHRCQHVGDSQVYQHDFQARSRVAVRTVHQPHHAEQGIGDGLHQERPVRVRPGPVRELLPRELRRARPQVRGAGRAAAAVRRQRARLAVAAQPARPILHAGHVQRVRVQHDVHSESQERGGHVLLRRARPRLLSAPAPGHSPRILRLSRP